MTAPTGLVVESVEGLAEALHTAVCPPSGVECSWLNDENGDPSCLPDYTRPLAATLIASRAVRSAAEVRAEAWDEGAWATAERWDCAPARRNPYRAALAEEGGA